ncbi:hypothetical protein CROQUDRAFT_717597 [Cronartium quercuum f. sp. fusiforme G11]|uniref:Calcineurin-like phosphoesterase domain-containing protein n=1 Tax=Cronartium quercuum f. sp. fusiforme G11 TaxID=708437 RepID=A0A9P6NAF1_9BASI|nr:hypothetical protein CROQUDRAFT_717597 [Cronartium quercuum f. sp. fusiforme G11]
MLRSTSTTKSSSSSSYLPFGSHRSPSPTSTLPGYSPIRSSKRKRKSSRPQNAFSNFLEDKLPSSLSSQIGPHSSILQTIIGLIILFGLIVYLINSFFIIIRFKLQDALMSSAWTSHSLSIRKQPLIFVHSSQSAAIVWETNKLASSSGRHLTLRYWPLTTGHHNQTQLKHTKEHRESIATLVEPTRVRPNGDEGSRRWVHTSYLSDLKTGTTYAYELVLIDPHQPNTKKAVKKIFSQHQFTWLGIDPPDLTKLDRLSTTSPSAKDPINVLHLVVIGDNHFGVGVFGKIVERMINKIKTYVPPFKSIFGPRQIIHHFYPLPIKPSLLLHLGDAVQNVDNLKQWQTDFWDPFTFKSKFSSEVPILYTRGNHDFDISGRNLYSGGLPMVQIGELNRTQNWKLEPNSALEIPGIAEADKNYTTIKIHPRDSYTRASYHAYSPHPRVRIIVCDSNLEPTREAFPGSRLSEVDEHERWLLWEMARPEWKEASIRIILVHIPPFVEYWDPVMWFGGHESFWGQYVRTRFTPHFHATSTLTRRYDIPPASLVISGHSHAYSRGFLSNFIAEPHFFDPSGGGSNSIPRDTIRAAKAERKKHADHPSDPQKENGVVYVVTGGAGGTLDKERVEDWGFYERSISGSFHFNHVMIDMSATLLSIDEWGSDWQDGREKREGFNKEHVRVYRLLGSQLVCAGTNESWESGHYQATDRLIWTSIDPNGKVLDRFVIEADSCR